MEPTALETALDNLQKDLKSFTDKGDAERKSHGDMLTETKTAIAAIQTQVDAIDKKMVEKSTAGTESKNLIQTLEENEDICRLIKDKRGSGEITLKGRQAELMFARKATVTEAAAGFMTTGVMPIDRTPGIVTEARQALRVRDMLTARPTALPLIDFVKVNSPMTRASPQTEAASKFENAVTFTTKSERVRTLATIIPASRQIMEDFTELAGFLDTSLRYYVDLAEEIQLLSGDATGENLDGLITQATAFSTALLSASAGWNKIDIVGRTIQQITVAKEVQPTFVVVHPTDWWGMRLQKDSYGRYLLGDPQQVVTPTLFGLTVVPTTSIASGTFLVGCGAPVSCEIRDRMELKVEIAYTHASDFAQNLISIRAEKRLALVVYRPASFITGTFSQSPA